ncbi:hypothetical protein BKI52_18350 [marine bacterium AO1-C]|nr:hypothetical protein BKI52_18350 [marine bacterium AO1-C]
MKRYQLPVMLILGLWLMGQTLVAQDKFFPKAKLLEDLKVFRAVMEEIHPGLYFYRSKDEINRDLAQIADSLKPQTSELDFYRQIIRFISKIGCGHTWADPEKTLDNVLWKETKQFPLKIRLIKGKMYCLETYTLQNKGIQLGDEILRINGYSSHTLVKQMMPYTVGDGTIVSGRMRLIENLFGFFYGLIYGQTNSFTVDYINAQGVQATTTLVGLSVAELKKIKQDLKNKLDDSPRNLHLQFYPKQGTAHLKIKGFFDWEVDSKEVSFEKALKKAFEKIAAAKTKYLILDLRNNGGGEGKLGLQTLTYLMNQPFIQFKEAFVKAINPKSRSYTDITDDLIKELTEVTKKKGDHHFVLTNTVSDKPVQPRQPNFAGKIYVLTDGNTFSTAADVAAILFAQRKATFIGEEMGGSYYGNSSDFFVFATLPHSKVKVRIPLVGFRNNVSKLFPNGRGVIPKHRIEPQIQDIIAGHDVVLKFALDLIQQQK